MRADEIDRLREAWRTLDEEAQALPAEPPVDPNEVWAAVSGELPAERRRELVDRMARDPQLSLEWRLASDLVDSAAEPTEAPVLPFQPQRPWRPWLAAAAALALAVVGFFLFRPQEPIYRGGGERIGAIGEPVLRLSAPVLRWTPVDKATYEVSVASADLESIYEARDLRKAELRLPADRLADLQVGDEVLWRVEAKLPNGDSVRSDTFVFRVEE
jgi:hypothetical protein